MQSPLAGDCQGRRHFQKPDRIKSVRVNKLCLARSSQHFRIRQSHIRYGSRVQNSAAAFRPYLNINDLRPPIQF